MIDLSHRPSIIELRRAHRTLAEILGAPPQVTPAEHDEIDASMQAGVVHPRLRQEPWDPTDADFERAAVELDTTPEKLRGYYVDWAWEIRCRVLAEDGVQ